MSKYKIDIVIGGIVGLGKSELSKLIAKEGYTLYPEPVFENPILPLYYEDMKRYSYLLQTYLLNKRFDHIKEADISKCSVSDRSIYEDEIFAKMLFDMGNMSHYEFQTYKDLLNTVLTNIEAPKLFILLEAPVEQAAENIKKRGRDFEQNIDIDFWKNLQKYYSRYFKDFSTCPVLKIDLTGLDFVNNKKDKEKVMNLIHEKLKEL